MEGKLRPSKVMTLQCNNNNRLPPWQQTTPASFQDNLLPHRLKHQAEVVLVVEVSEQSNTVELVIRISLIQLLQNPQLLLTRLLHHLVVTDDLDGYLLVTLQGVASPHNIAKHPLPCVPVHGIATVQLLTDTHT